MEREWYIGIDFGTSNTCVIAYDKANGELYTDSLTEKIGNATSLNIPTAIACEHIDSSVAQKTNSHETDPNWQEFLTTVFHMDDKGDCTYIGEETKAHPILRPFKDLKNTAREFTPNNGTFGEGAIKFPFSPCGLDSELELGNEDYPLTCTARKLIIRFLKKVLHIGEKKFGINKHTVKKIVIGQPVVDNNGVSYDKTLKELLSECFTGEKDNKEFIGKQTEKGWEDGIITVAEEPELAGVTYLSVDNKRAERKVLVVDIGGGTTDFCVLRYEKSEGGEDKFKAENIGSCNTAGNEIDELIFKLLPDDIPQSKELCRRLKEHLFAKNDGRQIFPIDTNKLEGFKIDKSAFSFLYKEDKSESNYIALSTGKLFYNKENKKSGDGIEKVFAKIGNALKAALTKPDTTQKVDIAEINTIFFVGGTSIITPLREHLTAVAEKACGHKLEIVDMFGENAKELTADWGKPLPVTCYNAVAIGACIKAMGENFSIKPKVRCRRFYARTANEEDLYEASENEIIIKSASGVPFMYAIYNRDKIKEWLDNVFPFEEETIQFKIDTLKYTYKITREELSKLNIAGQEKGLLIVLILNNIGIECKAYGCNTTNEEIKNCGLERVTQGALKINIIKL